MKKTLVSLAATFALALVGTAASAATIDISLDGLDSVDGIGSANNTVLAVVFAPGTVVTGFGWDVGITPNTDAGTLGGSWYSEASILLTDSLGGQGVNASPGVGVDNTGTEEMFFSSGGILVLADFLIPDIVLADGTLLVELFEAFDDEEGVIDASWSGTLTVEYVPVPAAVWLLGSGLLGLFGLRRRTA